jgi:A/G-specific adenine glycosylase
MSFKKLITWSEREFPDLPWRKNRSLYRTLVSEIMLQQTTVSTVRNHFEKFLVRFPDLASLAAASEQELLVAWKGLGYYRRARNLKKIAEALVNTYEGEFPKAADELQKIPGIGPYTSQALLAIGMDERGLALDANLERVLSRYFGFSEEKGLKLQKAIAAQFQQGKILKGMESYRALNEALMDLGRTFCQARKASCELCPLSNQCKAFQQGQPLSFPKVVNEKKKLDAHEITLLRVLVQKKNKILVYKKNEDEWLAGQYEVPTFILSSTDKKLGQYPKLERVFHPPLVTFTTGITKYKILNQVIELSEKELKLLHSSFKGEWRSSHDENANLSTATLKALKKLDSLSKSRR